MKKFGVKRLEARELAIDVLCDLAGALLFDLGIYNFAANAEFADMQKVWWFGSGSYAVYAPLLLLTVLSVVLLAVALMTCGDKSFVHREVTWNCGTYPTARQQYSATGFSKPLRRAFDFLLKPKRTATYLKKGNPYFGRQLEYKLSIPDQFTEKLYVPIQHYMVWSASFLRRIQQGSV